MTLICVKCGNTERFKKIANYREYTEEEHFMDGEQDTYDYGDHTTIDSEHLDDEPEITCMKCDHETKEGEDILDLYDNELILFKAYHTDDDGEWNDIKSEVPNEKFLREMATKLI